MSTPTDTQSVDSFEEYSVYIGSDCQPKLIGKIYVDKDDGEVEIVIPSAERIHNLEDNDSLLEKWSYFLNEIIFAKTA